MNLLFYWNKSRFKKEFATFEQDGFFYSLSERMNLINSGENLWVFAKKDENYVLVGKFVANSKFKRNGNYVMKFNTNKNLSKYFTTLPSLISQGNQFEAVLRKMNLSKNGKWNHEIALHFQGMSHIKIINDIQNSALDTLTREIKPH